MPGNKILCGLQGFLKTGTAQLLLYHWKSHGKSLNIKLPVIHGQYEKLSMTATSCRTCNNWTLPYLHSVPSNKQNSFRSLEAPHLENLTSTLHILATVNVSLHTIVLSHGLIKLSFSSQREIRVFLVLWGFLICFSTMQKAYMYLMCALTFWSF